MILGTKRESIQYRRGQVVVVANRSCAIFGSPSQPWAHPTKNLNCINVSPDDAMRKEREDDGLDDFRGEHKKQKKPERISTTWAVGNVLRATRGRL